MKLKMSKLNKYSKLIKMTKIFMISVMNYLIYKILYKATNRITKSFYNKLKIEFIIYNGLFYLKRLDLFIFIGISKRFFQEDFEICFINWN